MKKLAIVFSTVLALVACNKTPDPAVSVNPATVAVAYSGTDGTVAVELKANRPWKLTRDEQTWYSVEPLEGTGDATLYIRVDALEEVAARAAELTIQAETATAKLSIVQGLPEVEDVKSGSFVIEEVFFTGCLLEDGQTTDSMDGDQYFKITNNTDKLLYADGLIICKSSENSQNGGFSYWLVDDDLSGHILVKDMFQFPGDGDDVPVLPGNSLVVAFAAQDFATENGSGLDLSGADFEIFDGEELDVDNPDVPNMNIFLKSSKSFSFLHNRGYESYALVVLPDDVTEESFMADNAFTGTRSFWMDGEALVKGSDYLAGSYLIPNVWVVDGINCGVEEEYGNPAFNATIDAGYTGCGTVDKDPERFGKSAIRKSADGKLVDTNNSTNDFTRDATPSLK